ncbi:MAG TPA: hypothetical protein VFB21_01450 [Chthonomonadaceae bacterium]|nr:hypothetical protein [Chthonomonadaceae bacterium]
MQEILRKARKLLRYEGRNAALWKLIYRAEVPLLHAARLHRATLSRYNKVVVVVGTYGETTTTRAVRAALGLPEDCGRSSTRTVWIWSAGRCCASRRCAVVPLWR